jgi:ketosteroid isomerase-like protein
MKRFKSFFVASLFVASFATATAQKIDLKVEREKLMQASRDWSKFASSRDIENTLRYWTDDAIVISAGETDIKGKAAIRGMIEGSLKNPDFTISWEPQSAEVSERGDMGYLLEEAKITTKDPSGKVVTQHFNSVTIWKKQSDGSWKNVVDVMSPKAIE